MKGKKIQIVFKKMLSMLIMLLLVGGAFLRGTSIDVQATYLQDNTNTKEGVRYRGYLNAGKEKVYKITLDRARKVKFILNVNGVDADLYEYSIYNAKGTLISYDLITENNTLGSSTDYFTHYLPKGTYYFVIESYPDSRGGNYYWEYSTQPLSRITQGVHDSYSNAATMTLNKDYFDHMGINTKKNIIKFNINKPGYYQWYTTVSGAGKTDMEVCSSAGKTISIDTIEHNGNPTGVTAISKRMRLSKGTYYIVYESSLSSSSYCASGILKFRVKPY